MILGDGRTQSPRMGRNSGWWCVSEMPYGSLPVMLIIVVEEMPSSRLVKTHLPYDLLPQSILEQKCRVIVSE